MLIDIQKIKAYENLHIIFWLIKDSCWMLGLKLIGTLMVFPTIELAIILTYYTRKTNDLFINLSVLCWIVANSCWMLIEFFNYLEYKLLASIPFLLGFLFIGVFYYKKSHKQIDI